MPRCMKNLSNKFGDNVRIDMLLSRHSYPTPIFCLKNLMSNILCICNELVVMTRISFTFKHRTIVQGMKPIKHESFITGCSLALRVKEFY